MKRVVIRHIAEPATQQLLLEKGDIDIARNLGPDQLASLRDNPDITIDSNVKGTVYYLGLNQKNEILSKPKVRQALKYLVDYKGMEGTVVQDLMTVHQRSEEHTSELQSLMRTSYAVFCLKKK